MDTARRRVRQRQGQRQQLNAPDLSKPAFEDDDPSQVPAGTGDTWSPPLRRPVRVCDRSADVGTTHYWRDGATPGDFCLCGKRKKYDVTKPL